jgi:hypothetical protein
VVPNSFSIAETTQIKKWAVVSSPIILSNHQTLFKQLNEERKKERKIEIPHEEFD